MMKVRLYDVVQQLEQDGFKLSVRAEEGSRVLLIVTNTLADGGEDQVATLGLHNNVLGVNEEFDFWEKVGRYCRGSKAAAGEPAT